LILFILTFSYRQVWLNSNVDDRQFGYITKLKNKIPGLSLPPARPNSPKKKGKLEIPTPTSSPKE
jgi:hypothetical protein